MHQSFGTNTNRSFTASRWAADNRLFPATITITDHTVFISQPGGIERSIPLHQISSVSIRTGLVFAAIRVQSSGSQSIAWFGFRNQDALAIRDLIYSRMKKADPQ